MSDIVAMAAEVQDTPKYYGGTVTVQGRNLITSLLAGETIEFTRIVVGSGKMPEGVEPIDMIDLVNPVAEAVSTTPVVENGQMFMTVEYRNDLNGGLQEGFWLSEFGIYAKTEKTDEVMLYFATLGDSPQPVNAYKDNRVDIRRYPVTIALEVDANVEISYNPGAFITAEEAEQMVGAMVEQAVTEKGGGGYHSRLTLTIPASGWVEDGQPSNDHRYVCDVEASGVTSDLVPMGGALVGSFGISSAAGVVNGCNTFDGYIRFYSWDVPADDIQASITLFSKGGGSSGGGSGGGDIDIGNGLGYDQDGKLSVNIGEGMAFDENGALTVDTPTV